ncbi:MAG: hypothetical protein Unbinned4162contig1001_50 [Prokaryotic dsDNA virus sp.]|nr:MAG: hypothetical protein Unbinned4162contig1001_50 [Prokaryotic dsDNA virus sp.]|tara:strand:- start:242 stop:445 length:204 start_codon:yes stop_codon:yes gene_type:complete
MNSISNLGRKLNIIRGVKSLLFNDGKFNISRAIILLIAGIVIAVGYKVIGPEAINFTMQVLAEFSGD